MHNQGTFASFCLGLQKYIVCMVKDIIPSSCKQEQPQINSKKIKISLLIIIIKKK